MSQPPVRYEVLMPVAVGGGRSLWVRVGHAERNADGTIDATVESAGCSERFRLAEAASPDEERTLPGSPRGRRHLA